MNTFSKSSLQRMEGVNEDLCNLMKEVLEIYDITILEGLRTPERQQELLDSGQSKTLNSKHIRGLALDIAPYPINWHDTKRFYYLAGIVKAFASKRNLRVRWGGDWDSDSNFDDQSFNDLVHFELLNDN